MKNQNIVVLDSHPVALNTIQPGYSLAADWPESEVEMRRILDTHPTPLFMVDDVRALKLSIDDLRGCQSDQPGRGPTSPPS